MRSAARPDSRCAASRRQRAARADSGADPREARAGRRVRSSSPTATRARAPSSPRRSSAPPATRLATTTARGTSGRGTSRCRPRRVCRFHGHGARTSADRQARGRHPVRARDRGPRGRRRSRGHEGREGVGALRRGRVLLGRGVRRIVEPRPAVRVQARQGPGHPGLGRGRPGHEGRRPAQAHDPVRHGLRRARRAAA